VIDRFNRFWFAPIDASFLAVFRIMFGSLLLFESVNYGIFLCLHCMYRQTSLLFKFHHFEWVKLWPGFGLELNFLVMAISAICIILGYRYRVAMVVYTLCFSYLFLLDQTLYLNHFYLAILFCGIMIFAPAHRYWSLDARRKPEIASSTVPAWSRVWLVVQLEIVLIYAGIAKLNWDWLNLEPMRLWMNNRSHDAHPLLQWLTQDTGIAAASYGVLALHLIGAPLLLWKKTRLAVFLIYCFFHITNAFVFNIGIFPWMTIAATLVLFDPDWPKQFWQWLRSKNASLSAASHVDKSIADKNRLNTATAKIYNTSMAKVCLVGFICIWLIVQAVVPVRHFAIPGDVAWNEAGHRFSWRMKLRDKQGTAMFYVVKNGEPAIVVDPKTHLTAKQAWKMACIPDLIWQYAQFLDKQYAQLRSDDVKVYVDTSCSLNTRAKAPLINRLVDLSAIPRTEDVQNWIMPNNNLLPKKYLDL